MATRTTIRGGGWTTTTKVGRTPTGKTYSAMRTKSDVDGTVKKSTDIERGYRRNSLGKTVIKSIVKSTDPGLKPRKYAVRTKPSDNFMRSTSKRRRIS